MLSSRNYFRGSVNVLNNHSESHTFESDSDEDYEENDSPKFKQYKSESKSESLFNTKEESEPYDFNELTASTNCKENCWYCLNNFQPQNGVKRNEETKNHWELFKRLIKTKELKETSYLLCIDFQINIHANELLNGNMTLEIPIPEEIYVHLKYKLMNLENELRNHTKTLGIMIDQNRNLVYFRNKSNGKLIGYDKDAQRSIVDMMKEQTKMLAMLDKLNNS